MLFDPKWEVKTDPFTLSGLIAWLEKQPPDAGYNYGNCAGACLLDRYITSVTGKPSRPTALHWTICGDELGEGYAKIAFLKPWTFGAALERAREQFARSTS